MSHSNKRYVVYSTPSFSRYYLYCKYTHSGRWGFPYSVEWDRRVYSRTELVNYIGYYFRRDDIVRFTSDMSSVHYDDTRKYVPKQRPSRPGVKEWDRVTITWMCIKIIRNGVEEDANVKGLVREAQEFAERPKCSHRGHWTHKWKYCTPWKDQYKLRHQWEIHLPKHIDTFKDRAEEIQP